MNNFEHFVAISIARDVINEQLSPLPPQTPLQGRKTLVVAVFFSVFAEYTEKAVTL